MSQQSAYDAIIFTARKEEQFFLTTFFEKNCSKDSHYKGIKRVKWKDLDIGLVNIGGMGNVLSAIKAFEVLERTLPKTVFMVGLAAGYNPEIKQKESETSNATGNQNKTKDKLELGDVAIGQEICYHSYEKKESRHCEIRWTPDLSVNVDNEIIKWLRDEKINEISSSVNKLVQRWWDTKKYGKDNWIAEAVDPSDSETYKEQEKSANNIPIKCVTVSSGEAVIANKSFITKIRNTLGVAKKISLFEMESFGIGTVCKNFNIPFLLVKGVSDYAGAGKDDKHRWKAIAASSAVVIRLLETSFKTSILYKKSVPIRPGDLGTFNCLCSDRPKTCPHGQGVDDILKRNCINAGIAYDSENMKRAWVSRVFDGLALNRYSGKFSEGVLSEVKSGANITTFFPYTAKDLISMLIAEAKDQKLPLPLPEKDLNNFKKWDCKNIKNLVNVVKKQFPHFDELNTVCQTTKGVKPVKYGDKYSRVARIIVFDEDIATKEDVLANSLNIIFPLLLGTSVPTYFTCVHRLEKSQVSAIADVTFISRKSQSHGAKKNLVSFSFFEKSQTLIISGHIPCFETSTPMVGTPMAVKKLYDAWEYWCNGSGEVSVDLFQKFPKFNKITKS